MIKEILDFEKAYATAKELQSIEEELCYMDKLNKESNEAHQEELLQIAQLRNEGKFDEAISILNSLVFAYQEEEKKHENKILAIKFSIRERYLNALAAQTPAFIRNRLEQIRNSITDNYFISHKPVNQRKIFKMNFEQSTYLIDVSNIRADFVRDKDFDINLVFGTLTPKKEDLKRFDEITERRIILDTLLDYCGAELNALAVAGEDTSKDLDIILKTAKAIYSRTKGKIFPFIEVSKTTREETGFKNAYLINSASWITEASYIRPKKDLKETADGKVAIIHKDLQITAEDTAVLQGYTTSTAKLFNFILKKATETGTPYIHTSINEYMNFRGLKDHKSAIAQFDKDTDILLAYRFFVKKKDNSYIKMNIFDGIGRQAGSQKITIKLGETFFKSYTKLPFLQIPSDLMKIDDRKNPNSFSLGYYLAYLKRVNANKKDKKNKPLIISVKKLLEASPEIPTAKELRKKKSYHITQQIIEPLERDLNALDYLFTWEYCRAKGEPLTDIDLSTFDYKAFISCYVAISWKK